MRRAIIVVTGVFFVGVAAMLGPVLMQRFGVLSLYRQVVASGQVKVSDIETGWDRVCMATAYCGGAGDLPGDICDSFQEDGVWGMVFYRGAKVINITKYTGHVRYNGADRCFSYLQEPAFVIHGDNQLTMRVSK